jgi:hypothetical protein
MLDPNTPEGKKFSQAFKEEMDNRVKFHETLNKIAEGNGSIEELSKNWKGMADYILNIDKAAGEGKSGAADILGKIGKAYGVSKDELLKGAKKNEGSEEWNPNKKEEPTPTSK